MVRKPQLSEDSFLGHLFAPSKNPLPSGLRHRSLKGLKGQSKSRVAAFNRMSPSSQEVLKRSGMQGQYLAGDATLADAKRGLRQVAVSKGIAKPSKQPTYTPGRTLDDQIAGYVYRSLTTIAQRPVVNYNKIRQRVPHLPDDIKPKVLKWTPGKIRAYAGNHDNVVIINGKEFNPLWYK
jgi:hypothetical protein